MPLHETLYIPLSALEMRISTIPRPSESNAN